MTRPVAARRPLLSIGLASAAALAYEILLLRLFAITQWHHTTYMVISLALLGYGASGSLLGWWGKRWVERFRRAYPLALLLAGVAMIVCFVLAQRVAVHPEELLWSPRQIVRLAAVYLLLALPFLGVACAVGMTLMRHRAQAVYASDLVGAGLGAAAVVAVLYALHPTQALRAVACLALAAAIVATVETRSPDAPARVSRTGWLALLSIGIVVLAPASWVRLEPSPYKGLSQLLRVPGARVVHERSSPLGLVSAVESREVPLRHAPGLSLAARHEPPRQVALFVDGGGMSAIPDATGGEATLDYLHQSTAALPYHLRPPGSVLILAAGGGERLQRARLHGADSIVAVELDRRIVDLARGEYGTYSGRIWESPEVEAVVSEVRGFVGRESRRFDLVELVTLGGSGGPSPGLHGLAEGYLLTVEAIEAFLDRVAPGGLLAITGWVSTPARGTIKRTATVLEALRRAGVAAPERRLAVIRGWQTSTILVKHGEFEPEEIARLERFCAERLFDVVFFPGMERARANRFNRRATPELHDAVVALLGERPEGFLERSKFDLSPATDDRPFAGQFFRWRSLPEILELRGRGGLPLLEASYLVLIATLVQALVLSLLVIGLPAWWRRRRARPGESGQGRRVVPYFGGLGLGFLLLEVALLQKLTLWLQHPVLAAAVVLSGFLLFAGLGSFAAGRSTRESSHRTAMCALAGVCVWGGVTLVALHVGTPWLVSAPLVVRLSAALGLIGPLAFAMGMPFPLGLEALRGRDPGLIPWAWGVNGCASVVSPVLATVLAVHLGFSTVVLIGLVLYAATATVFPDAAGAAE